jgi:hypothetical protein
MRRMTRYLTLGTLALSLLASCQEVPGALAPIFNSVSTGGGSAPTIQGTVKKPQANLRVGLLGQPQAGGQRVEFSSASASSGSFGIQLNQPGIELLQPPAEDKSYIFMLTAYIDTNGNNRYDEGVDRIINGSSGASLRWFANAGPSNQAGWNVYDPASGTYTQSFNVAYNL